MANQPKKYKKFVATAATATLVASAIVPVASAASFSDTTGNTHEAAISALSDAGIIKGYADGTFKPNKELTRSDVVKLLGKYLVSEGHSIPEDARTNMRFADLNSKSNGELLDYAAVVADAGVFAGSNGKLLAGDAITRENMAIVLVRMVNTLKDVSLEEFVDGQSFTQEVKDLNVAKAEARSAINVLDFYDITTATNFLPKNTVTRGQFATFLNNVIKADFAGASATSGTVTAINATTVEVKFGKDVTAQEISAMKFTIDGLEVKNAVAKQSDKSVVVLTTVAQEAGKEYTVKLDGNTIGKFTGVSAVIPTAVKMVEFTNPVVEKETTQVGSHTSQQAPLGTQVTLKAQVTVAEGQSKAGIPVTFNIVNTQLNNANPGGALNQPIVVEAKTDENGVATYTYTRYASTQYQLVTSDEVQVYATGNPTARDFSRTYWANIQPLTITEVTQGNDLNNGAKKVYKVKLAGGANTDINVGFLDNVNVDPNKANKGVIVTDAFGQVLDYPGQYTTSLGDQRTTNKVVKLKLDANGETTFTLTGSNETVTPFVFKDETAINNTDPSVGRFDKSELVAFAAPVKFAKVQNLGLTNDAQGVQKSAAFSTRSNVVLTAAYDAIYANRNVLTASQYGAALKNAGGRTYTSVLTDDKGVKAPTGTVVKVKVDIGTALSSNDNTAHVYLADNNAKRVYRLADNEEINLYTDSNGQVSYRLFGKKDSYATPTVFVESGDRAGLDTNDLQKAGEMVHFSDAVINTAKLTVEDAETASSIVADTAAVRYGTVDQNGFNYFDGNEFVTTFQLTTTFATALVKYTDATGDKELPINAGSSYSNTVAVPSVDGVSEITVESTRGNRVDIVASASRASLPILNASATFSKVTNEGVGVGQSVTGKVVAIDKVANRILLTNAAGTKTYELNYGGSVNLVTRNSPNSIATFEKELQVGEELKFTQATDNTVATFHNYDYTASAISVEKAVTVVIADDLAKYDDATSEATKGYDFDGKTIGAADKPAKFEILGNNVILKNATINGDIYVDARVFNDFTLSGVTVNGNVYINGGDGDTINLINSTINGTVYLNVKEHLALTNTTIQNVVVKANASKVTGTGTIGTVTHETYVNVPLQVGTGVTVTNGAVTPPTFTSSTNVTTANDVATLGLVGTKATSSADAVATAEIKDGKVAITSKGKGTAVITVADEDTKTTDATINVTVSETGVITLGTITKAVTEKETEVTGVTLSEITTFVNPTALGKVAVIIEPAQLTGDLKDATALVLTVNGKTYEAALEDGEFFFSILTSEATLDEVKAGKVTKK